MPVTFTYATKVAPPPIDGYAQAAITKIRWDWVSEAGGGTTGDATELRFGGVPSRIVFIPGDVPPNAEYTVGVYDDEGCDLLWWELEDVLIPARIIDLPLWQIISNSTLRITVGATGGAGRTGAVILYIMNFG